ncbi:MAG: hypothetical protein NC213_07180 [Acetobacter sp.]|nr:hypothetical protein [Bacteroides sp.]MCM1341511.1 hypothetical protein [Acetobacter sp.]MCM1433701.1 hypothetical protein [Clostridiales bacterium]
MKSRDYIDNVLSHISNNEYSKSVESELQAHIEDEIEYYVSLGYSVKDAEYIVSEKMGDSAIAGKQLDMLSSDKASKIFSIIVLLLYFAEIVYFFISILAWESDYSVFGMISETSILLLSLITLLISNKYKNSALPFVSLAFTACFYFIFVLLNSSALLYSAFLLCTGKFNDIKVLLDVDNHITGRAFYIISNFIYFALLCAHIYIVKNNSDFKKQKYSLKKVHIEIIIKKIFLVSLALIVIINAGTFVVLFLDKDEHGYYDGVSVVESDIECDFEDFEVKDNYIEIHYDWGDVFAWSDSPVFNEDSVDMLLDTVEYNSTISYDTHTIYGEFKADKKYAAVIPVKYDYDTDTYIPITDNAKWYLTTDTDEITGQINDDIYYKIKIV